MTAKQVSVVSGHSVRVGACEYGIGRKPQRAAGTSRASAMGWAQRLRRVFSIDIERCERCGGAVRIIACTEDPELIEKILQHVGLGAAAAGEPLPRAPPYNTPPSSPRGGWPCSAGVTRKAGPPLSRPNSPPRRLNPTPHAVRPPIRRLMVYPSYPPTH
jgi:hypothetical protein